MAEAKRLWLLRHPNVVQVYAVLHSREEAVDVQGGAQEEEEEEEPVNYMALARLGRSLQAMLDNDKMYALFCLPMPACCTHVGCQRLLFNERHAVKLKHSKAGETLGVGAQILHLSAEASGTHCTQCPNHFKQSMPSYNTTHLMSVSLLQV